MQCLRFSGSAATSFLRTASSIWDALYMVSLDLSVVSHKQLTVVKRLLKNKMIEEHQRHVACICPRTERLRINYEFLHCRVMETLMRQNIFKLGSYISDVMDIYDDTWFRRGER